MINLTYTDHSIPLSTHPPLTMLRSSRDAQFTQTCSQFDCTKPI